MNPKFKQLLQNRGFMRLWFSQVASQVTINMVNFALIARIFENTGSAVAVSFLWITYGLPALLVGPVVGPLIDLVPKRRILMATNFLQAVAIFSYLLVRQKLFPLYTIVFIYSFLDQFYMPSEGASIPSLVPRKLLAEANSLYSMTFQVALLFGFAMSGSLIAALGANSPFIIGAVLLLLATWSVYGLPEKEPLKKTRSFGDYWRNLTYGYQYVRSQPFIYLPILLIMGFQVVFSIVAVVFPSYVSEVLHLAIREASWVLVIPCGIGALLSALYVMPRVLMGVRKLRIIHLGLAGASLCLLLMAFVVPFLGDLWRPWVASFSALLGGMSGILLLVPANTLIQEKTPAILRGRVYGSLSFLLTIAIVAPTLVGATVADVLGPQTLVVILALATLGMLVALRTKGKELMHQSFLAEEGR